MYLALLFLYFVLIYFFFPETKGLSPEEASVLLDGKEAVERVRAAAMAVTDHGDQTVLEGVDGEKNASSTTSTVPVEEKV